MINQCSVKDDHVCVIISGPGFTPHVDRDGSPAVAPRVPFKISQREFSSSQCSNAKMINSANLMCYFLLFIFNYRNRTLHSGKVAYPEQDGVPHSVAPCVQICVVSCHLLHTDPFERFFE